MRFRERIGLIRDSIRIFREAKDKLSRCIIYEYVFIDCEHDLFYCVSISRIDGPWHKYYRYRIANYNADIDIQAVHIIYNDLLSPVHIYKLLLKQREN